MLTLEKTWELAQAWYSSRLRADYRGRTREEVEAILAGVGLDSPFWRF